MANLEGKTAIVTGSSRGIGRAIAVRLARDGARVVVCARTSSDLADVVREIQSASGAAAAAALDLRDPATPSRLVDFAVSTFGRLDIVVNNAGATRRGLFVQLRDEDWEDSFALKFFGAVRVTRSAWPHLQKSKGSVVFISGAGGRTPGAEFAAGGAVNAGLLSITKALAETGIRDGVQVNSVNPGAVRTDRLKTRLAATMQEKGIDLAAAERQFVEASGVTKIGEPQEIAALVSFVVGPEGRFLHGSLIDMDGGATKTI
ncbi:MAG TPA: SDR family NAD(P)-dependent oxidoreductase [Terriglobia bacterium]|nr:SDR family NAD(P)-dependent oxidoreductase [Terriglobia bacterium]